MVLCAPILNLSTQKTDISSSKSIFRPHSLTNFVMRDYSNRWIVSKCFISRVVLNFLETHAYLRNYTWVIHAKTQANIQLLKSRGLETCSISNKELEALTYSHK